MPNTCIKKFKLIAITSRTYNKAKKIADKFNIQNVHTNLNEMVLKNNIDCKTSHIENKLLMASISMVYFVHSFFVYDEIRDRNKYPKVPCSSSVIVALDTFQEHTFTLFVHVANLWLSLIHI